MTQVGLDRAQHQRRRSVAVAVDLGQCVEFDRIAQTGTGAVRLDVVHLGRGQARHRKCLAHQRLLGRAVGDGLATAGAVLVDRRPANHGQHGVTVAVRVLEALEHHDAATLAAHVAVGVGVEGFARSVHRKHPEP